MIAYLLTLTMITKFRWLNDITNLRHKTFPMSPSLDKTMFAFHFYDAVSVKNNLPIMHKHRMARQASYFLPGFCSCLIKTRTWYSLFMQSIPHPHTRPWFTVLQIRFFKDNFSYFTAKSYIDSSLELSESTFQLWKLKINPKLSLLHHLIWGSECRCCDRSCKGSSALPTRSNWS